MARRSPPPFFTASRLRFLFILTTIFLFREAHRVPAPSNTPHFRQQQQQNNTSLNIPLNATKLAPLIPESHSHHQRRRHHHHHHHHHRHHHDPDKHTFEKARTTGPHPQFTGCSLGMRDGQNITRVSYTLYKLIRLFGLKSMIDIPAGRHAEWMPEVVREISYDMPMFSYVGVDDAAGVRIAKKALRGVVDGEFHERIQGNGTDLLFYWTELDGSGNDARTKSYESVVMDIFRRARELRVGYVVIGQFPSLRGPVPEFRKGKWRWQGESEETKMKAPFLLNQHLRGVVAVEAGAKPYMLYLTLYAVSGVMHSELF